MNPVLVTDFLCVELAVFIGSKSKVIRENEYSRIRIYVFRKKCDFFSFISLIVLNIQGYVKSVFSFTGVEGYIQL